MGSDSDNTPRALALEFETICASILADAGYMIERERRPDRDGSWRVDFIASRHLREKVPENRWIDVKWMPLPEATLQVAQNIASLHAVDGAQPSGARQTLILSAAIPETSQRWVRGEYSIDVWGRSQLRRLANGELKRALDDFLAKSDAWHAQIRANPPLAKARTLAEAGAIEAEMRAERADAFALALTSDPNESRVSGKSLRAELRAVPSGKEGAYAYEQLIERIFAFLFPGDLLRTGPATKRTEDGLNIYDLVYQIRNRSNFWINLSRDLRSRMLIVECKNYDKPIRAMQVFTTERYLSPVALRSIALIVTRRAPHETALLAASGAMRESGKLMLFLDDKAINAMLDARDLQLSGKGRGVEENDPAEVIDHRLHQFLATLPR